MLFRSYSTLTRQGELAPAGMKSAEALAALETLCSPFALLGLTPMQTREAVRAFARANGIGPRLYDRLIGEVALIHAIPVIATLNTGHFRDLFPTLQIVTPEVYLGRNR